MPSSGRRPLKAIVLIFDEWDYQYGFTQRPGWIRLPHIDRFVAEYGSYTHCWPPAGETLRSIPSLATGKSWLGAIPGIGLELLLKDAGTGAWVPWSQTDDLFMSLSQIGWRTEMIQWHHVLPTSYLARRPGLTVVHFAGSPEALRAQTAYRSYGGTLGRCWVRLFQSYRSFLRIWTLPEEIQDRVTMVNGMWDALYGSVRSQQFDFIWAHLPFPHLPAIADARSNAFLVRPDPFGTNLDNMILADWTIGRLREQLEALQAWDPTLVILTADHWQRELSGLNLPEIKGKYATDAGLRVPLLVKWPGQKEPWVVDNPVQNASIRRMVEAVALGQDGGEAFPMDLPRAGMRDVLLNNKEN